MAEWESTPRDRGLGDESFFLMIEDLNDGSGNAHVGAWNADADLEGEFAEVNADERLAAAKVLAGPGYVVIRSEDASDAAHTLRGIEYKGATIYDDLANRIEGL